MPTKFDWERFQAAYTNASDSVRQLVDSDAIPQCVEKLVAEYQLPATMRAGMIVCSTNKVLGLGEDSDTLNFLLAAQIPLTQAQAITTALDACIFEYSDIQHQTTEIAMAEQALDSLPAIRTMTGDASPASPEPVYSSTQAAILQEAAQVTERQKQPPTQSQATWPRWDTG